MMTKEQEDYIFKLKAELMFRGKDEDELQDHFEMAEANGDDVSNILNTPVKDYADNFSEEMSFTKGLPKYLTYFVLFMFAIFTIPDFFENDFTLTLGYILNTIFIFVLSVVVPLFLIKKAIMKYGDAKRVYVYAFIGGIILFSLMVLSTFIAKRYPIYTLVTLDQTQSIITGLILLAIVMVLCFIVKQKLFALVIFIVCLPNLIGQIFKAHSHSNEQFLAISIVLYIVLIIGMNIAFFVHAYYTNRKERKHHS
ncbi:hypothetical protein ACMFKE_07295 [Staphylococcus haemolyticus]|uniref:hypothetical protein n=1 Tax=Staphylococcus haemolyticus TaxID=1283 RepID=UPI0039BD43A2